MSSSHPALSPVDASGFASVVGIDVGSEHLLYTLCQPDKRAVNQPTELSNDRSGFARLDAALRCLGVPAARLLLSGEACASYAPDELIATSRELERLHHQLSAEVARYTNEIHALVVPFPEFTQVKALPCAATALSLLQRSPSAAALVEAGVEALATALHELAPRRYGRLSRPPAGGWPRRAR